MLLSVWTWQACPSVRGMCVCACVSVCCCASISLLQTEQKQPCRLFSLSPSSSWLTLRQACGGYTLRPLSAYHTHIYTLLGSLEANAQTESIHVWPREKCILGLAALFLVCKCLSLSAGSYTFWQTNDTLKGTCTAELGHLFELICSKSQTVFQINHKSVFICSWTG